MNNNNSHVLANLEELTSDQLAKFTEQLLDLLPPANKEELLNLFLLPNSNKDFMASSSNSLKEESLEISRKEVESYLDQIAVKSLLEKRRERNKKYREKIKKDPIAKKRELEKKRQRNKRYREKIKKDPIAKKIELDKQRERNRKYVEKVKADPEATRIKLEKRREYYKKKREKINSDPEIRKNYLERRNELYKKNIEKKVMLGHRKNYVKNL